MIEGELWARIRPLAACCEATASYLARVHGITDVAALENGLRGRRQHRQEHRGRLRALRRAGNAYTSRSTSQEYRRTSWRICARQEGCWLRYRHIHQDIDVGAKRSGDAGQGRG